MNYLWLRLLRWWWRPKANHPLLMRRLSDPIHNLNFVLTRYLAVDLETTSLNPKQGEIASIGWVVIENGEIQLDETGYYRIVLQNEVGQSAVFHQLTDTELAQGHTLDIALKALLEVAKNSVLVFHNATLDLGYLNQYLIREWGAPLLMPYVDTMEFERKKLLRDQEHIKPGELRLFQCRERYGLPAVELHDALGDALATAELWLAINAKI